MGELGLGSVQFGVDYGATRSEPRPAPTEVGEILHRAAGAGIRVVDTAPSYGDAESLLGTLRPAHARFRWVTKTAGPADAAAPLLESVETSRARLGTRSLYGVLDHFPEALAGSAGERRIQQLEALRARGWAQKVGVSVYRAEQIEAVAGGSFPDLVQVPLNALDQRLLEDGTLANLARRGVEVHARSVFLQGLLLVEPERIPEPLAGLRAPVARFRRVARERGLEPAEAALGFALGLDTVDVVLCGVQRLAELDALLAAAARAAAVEPRWFAGVGCADAELLDPSQWPALVP